MRYKPFPRDEQDSKGARQCEKPGCVEKTRDRKPFCSDHVDEHPYVKLILATLAGDEAEIERIKAKGKKAVELDGSLITSILQKLEQMGSLTKERLAREVWREQPIIDAAVAVLVKRKIVELGMTNRGSTVVILLAKPSPNGEHPD